MQNERAPKLFTKDLQFIVCLNASEESYLFEVFQDIKFRLFKRDNISALFICKFIVKDLLLKNIVGLSSRSFGKEDSDFDLNKSLNVIELDSSWKEPKNGELISNIYLYLTDTGEKMWQNGYPNISERRASYLIFNQSKFTY